MKIMVKGFAVAAAMMLATSAVADSYLYWMSNGTDKFGNDWSYAKVKYDSGSGTGYLAAGTDATTFAKSLQYANEFYSMQVAIGSLTLGSSYTFALELFNGSGDSIALSEWVAYNSSFVGNKSFAASEATFNFWQVPEPTSGLLTMLGFGLLALRRKQEKA